MKKVLLAIVALIVLYVAFEWLMLPDVSELAKGNPRTTAFIERRKKQLRAEGKDDTIKQQWVRYERISPYLRRAVLVSEDNSFYEHEGVDVEGIKEAVRKDWANRRFSHGGSTITQQLAKNLYLSPSKNPIRKVKELIITRRLENELTKKRIFEIYLNVVEFGERVYGAEAAARYYFGTSAAGLSPSQAALLAGCLPNPRVMNPGKPNKRLKARQRIILSRMRRWGSMFEKEVLTEKKKEEPRPAPVETTAPTETAVDTTVPEEPEPEEPSPSTETSTTEAPPEETPPVTETATAT